MISQRKLYDKIMRKVAKSVKRIILDEFEGLDEYNVAGYNIPSIKSQKMSDFDDIGKTIPFKDQLFTKQVEGLFQKMKQNYRYNAWMKFFPKNSKIQWSYKTEYAACTDGYTGNIVMNPSKMQEVFSRMGEKGIQVTILHEAGHNYKNSIIKQQNLGNNPSDWSLATRNVNDDKWINLQITKLWPEFKDVIPQMGMIINESKEYNMNKNRVYNSLMKRISKSVKRAINEAVNREQYNDMWDDTFDEMGYSPEDRDNHRVRNQVSRRLNQRLRDEFDDSQFHVGQHIRILGVNDPDSDTNIESYDMDRLSGTEGVIEYIDDMGQLHGTWGGLALIPEVDDIEIIED